VRFAIAHASWLPDRRRTLARLLEQLGEDVLVSASAGPEHASVWARRLWETAASRFPGEHVCFLNDDVLVHPELRRIVEAMVAAVPDEPLSLHTNVLGAAAEEMKGHHWCRCYWYTGPAVVLPPEALRSLLAWVYRTPWAFLSRVNEDNAAIHWSWAEQRPFWCAIPAPVIHDTGTPSTLGYDDHAFRVPTVPWTAFEWEGARLTDSAWWRVEAPPPWVPNPWMPAEKLETVRRVLAEPGARLCGACQERQAAVGAWDLHLCRRCLVLMYSAASRGQEAR
jgi:hypothetical protein